jgi:hypothetical protein
MYLRSLSLRPRLAALFYSVVALVFVSLARAQDWSLPPNISTHTSAPALRPFDATAAPGMQLASVDTSVLAPIPPATTGSDTASMTSAPAADAVSSSSAANVDMSAATPVAPPADPSVPVLKIGGPQGAKSVPQTPAVSTDATSDASDGTLPTSNDTTSDAAPAPVANLVATTAGADSSDSGNPSDKNSTEVAANEPVPAPGEITAAAIAAMPSASTPSQNATVNLINLMVKRDLISRDDADNLIRQAQEEADLAHAQAAATQATAERALTTQQNTPAQQQAAPPPSNADDEVRIAYVPDVVKKQITDQVTQNVMEQTRQEQLADTIAADQVPAWVKMFHVSGDIRIRYEEDWFPSGNAQAGNFVNFNSINTGSPINVSKSAPTAPQIPQYDVNQDRDRLRVRMRLGANIDLGQNFTSGVRLATGSDDTPTSENQTLGAANGQGGYFSKYQVWLDRAFLRYDVPTSGKDNASVTIGRFDNPFYGTTMVWSNDLAFDGAVAKGSYEVAPGVTPFLTAGAFPVFNTDFNFSTNDTSKFTSEDKYLFGIQGGTKWQINKDVSVTGAAALYDFENIQGDISDPIDVQDAAGDVAGSTDDSRPSFAQNGNTYIALRNYVGSAASGQYQQQYFGLASKFQVFSLYGQLDYSHFDPFHISLTGEFIENVAFDRSAIEAAGPASDPGPQNNTYSSSPNSFYGGNIGYLVHMDFGKPVIEDLWDWNVRLSYRYVQTDATVDAFTDSDFGAPLYGTNLKGFTIGGNLGLSKRVWLGLRYMSADQVAGPTFHSDLMQFDVNAKF